MTGGNQCGIWYEVDGYHGQIMKDLGVGADASGYIEIERLGSGRLVYEPGRQRVVVLFPSGRSEDVVGYRDLAVVALKQRFPKGTWGPGLWKILMECR